MIFYHHDYKYNLCFLCISSVISDSISADWPTVQNEFEELFPVGIVHDCFTCKNIRYVTRLTFKKNVNLRSLQGLYPKIKTGFTSSKTISWNCASGV